MAGGRASLAHWRGVGPWRTAQHSTPGESSPTQCTTNAICHSALVSTRSTPPPPPLSRHLSACTVAPASSTSQHASRSAARAGDHAPLEAAIRRVFYLANEGTHREHEVQLPANSVALAALGRADAVMYAVGSLYTSIAPSLALRGVGEAVAERSGPKVLLLNGCHDRETSRCLRHDGPMDAVRPEQAPPPSPPPSSPPPGCSPVQRTVSCTPRRLQDSLVLYAACTHG